MSTGNPAAGGQRQLITLSRIRAGDMTRSLLQDPKGVRMSRLVTIFGGSGFVGRYIARRMAKEGWRVRVAVRRPNEAMFVRPYGAVGQVEPVLCNIRNDASVASVMQGADAVVNCVGILAESGRNGFDAVQREGAGRIARIAAEQGVARMVHVSAIGADENAASAYARTKALGEAAVLEHMPDAIILRPSIVFGAEDQFFNRFASMARLAGAGRGPPPERGAVRQALRRGRAGRAGLVQHSRRCLGAGGDAGRRCGGELRGHPERIGQKQL